MAIKGAAITTLEGLGTAAKPHPLQTAFIAEQAVQCGYCVNGMIMSAVSLLNKNKNPSEAQIRDALARIEKAIPRGATAGARYPEPAMRAVNR